MPGRKARSTGRKRLRPPPNGLERSPRNLRPATTATAKPAVAAPKRHPRLPARRRSRRHRQLPRRSRQAAGAASGGPARHEAGSAVRPDRSASSGWRTDTGIYHCATGRRTRGRRAHHLLRGRLGGHRAGEQAARSRPLPSRRARGGVRFLLGRDRERLAAASAAFRRRLLPVFHDSPPPRADESARRRI